MNRKEQERLARKKDILEAALVLFAEKDFHEVTVDEIAECVGLSKGTLYLYFKNKEDLFFSIIEEKTDELFHRLQSAIQGNAPYLKRLEDLIRSYLAFFEEHKHYFKIIHMVKSFFDYGDLLQRFVVEGQKQKIFRKMPPELITKALRGLLNSFTFQCIFMEGEYSLVEETPRVLDLFLNGVQDH